MPPIVNATLTRVAGAPSTDDWDGTTAPGVEKWTGSIPAYYREKVQRVTTGTGVDVLLARTLYIDTPRALEVGVDTDDVLEFTAHGRSMTGRAKVIATAEVPGASVDVQTTRLELVDA